MNSTTLAVDGMTCASCVRRVERALAAVAGVESVSVNLATERATIEAAGPLDFAALRDSIMRAGYAARAIDLAAPRADGPLSGPSSWQVIAAFVLSAPLFVEMIASMDGQARIPASVQWLLASIVVFGLGARFFGAALRALRARTGNMDLLVVLGTTAAWALSSWQAFFAASPGPLYFDAASGVIAFVLLGKRLESVAKRRTADALRALESLRPALARVRRARGVVEVPVASLAIGDVVELAPGDRIAADGVVLEGRGHVDESLVTGESVPAARGPGDAVIGGALNVDGALAMRVTAVGAESRLARIVRLVEQAQTMKSPVQRQVDRVSTVFVPVVLGIALATLAGWLLAGASFGDALVDAVAVLVIACPCALGLATPAAIMAGTGAAAQRGILIRDPDVLERAIDVDVVVFDKTGTLTSATPRLAEVVVGAGMSRAAALAIAAGLQRSSRHPLAAALREASPASPQVALQTTALPGRGIRGSIDGVDLWLGSDRLAAELEARDDDELLQASSRLDADGSSLAWLLRRSGPGIDRIALFAFQDIAKPHADDAVRALESRGLRIIVMTGDRQASADRLARALGLDDVRAGVLPEQKAAAVAALQAEGAIVAMVGDGLNDAPALARADLGIAVAHGLDAAVDSAGIALLRDDPRLVPAALEIARRTHAKIRQGLMWAFVYNVIGIPLAAFGYLSPLVAGAAMALSSVSVVLNALTLRRFGTST